MFDKQLLPELRAKEFTVAREKQPIDDVRSARSGIYRKGSTAQWGGSSRGYAFRVSTGDVFTGKEAPRMVPSSDLRAAIDGMDAEYRVYGYGSVTDIGYVMYDAFGPYIEIMDARAFDNGLKNNDLQVSFLIGHEGLGMATTRAGSMKVGVDDVGIWFVAALDLRESDSADVYNKLERGSTSSETSVAGVVDDYEWNEDYDEIRILDWNMHRGEISIVRAGANPAGWVQVAPNKVTKVDEGTLSALSECRAILTNTTPLET